MSIRVRHSARLDMAKFALGDAVKKSRGGEGVVRAIFTTVKGELTYAIEKEGTVDFVEETNLSRPRDQETAA